MGYSRHTTPERVTPETKSRARHRVDQTPALVESKGRGPRQPIHDGVLHQGHIGGLFPHWRDGIPRDGALLGHLGEEFLGLAHGERCSRRQHPGPEEGCSACWGSSRRRDVEHLDGGASHTPSRSANGYFDSQAAFILFDGPVLGPLNGK